MFGVRADAVVLECPFDRLLTTVEHRFELMGVPAFPLARLLTFWGGVGGDTHGVENMVFTSFRYYLP